MKIGVARPVVYRQGGTVLATALESRTGGHAKRGFALMAVPLFVLALPLFFHRSREQAVGPWSARYVALLLAAVLAAVAVSWWVGRRCGRQRSLRTAQRSVLVILFSLLALAVLEVGLGWLYGDAFATYRKWGQRRSTIYTYEAQPNHRWHAQGATYTTDGNGFRVNLRRPDWEEEWPRLREGGGRLIAVLGGSSAFGFGLDDDETWPHLLEKARAGSTSPTLVVNAGNNGHASLQLATRAYLKVLPKRPTQVLYYGAMNDVWHRGTDVDKLEVQGEIVLAASQRSYIARKHPDWNFYLRTMIAHALRKRFPGVFGAADEENEVTAGRPAEALRARIGENARRFGRNLRTLADMCRRAGAELVLTTFLYDPEPLKEFVRAALARHNEVLRDVARTEGLRLIDLWRAFEPVPDKAEFFFGDHYHPSPRGADWIAKQLAGALR